MTKEAIEYHLSVISKFPREEWISPTNYQCDDYAVLDDLFEWGLVERKIEYSYRGASKVITGSEIFFKIPSILAFTTLSSVINHP